MPHEAPPPPPGRGTVPARRPRPDEEPDAYCTACGEPLYRYDGSYWERTLQGEDGLGLHPCPPFDVYPVDPEEEEED